MEIITSIIFITGMYFIMYGFLACSPSTVIEYRYIPRTFKEDQKEPVSVLDLYDTMFQRKSLLS